MKPPLDRTKLLTAAVVLAIPFVVCIGARFFGAYRWDAGTRELRRHLERGDRAIPPKETPYRVYQAEGCRRTLGLASCLTKRRARGERASA